MSFASIRTQNAGRLNEVSNFLNFINLQEPNLTTNPLAVTPQEIKIMRGLFYVHMYAGIESTINELVQQIIILINAKNVRLHHMTTLLKVLSLRDVLLSYRQCGPDKVKIKGQEIIHMATSKTFHILSETMFSSQLQNVWIKTIEELLASFGMDRLNFTRIERVTVDEIVDRRNAVAHGRETATSVGQSLGSSDLQVKLQTVQIFLDKVIDHFEDFFTNKKFIQTKERRKYL